MVTTSLPYLGPSLRLNPGENIIRVGPLTVIFFSKVAQTVHSAVVSSSIVNCLHKML